MSDTSKIEWTDATWNPVRGCSIVSKGCTNCYAMKQAHRFSGAGQAYEGLTQLTRGGPVWTGKVREVPELLDAPLRWKKPRRVFVNSMSDLFHEDVHDEFIGRVWQTMAWSQQHTFQILTKRPARMREWVATRAQDVLFAGEREEHDDALRRHGWPLRNVWLGVSVEDQASADERIPLLLQTPAAVRWISAEPLLGAIQLRWDRWLPISGFEEVEAGARTLEWVVAGGESGPKARPSHPDWFRSLRDQCQAARVPFFFKQWGEWWEAAPEMREDDGSHVEVSVPSADADEWFLKGDCLIAIDGRVVHSPADLPPDVHFRLMQRFGKRNTGRTLDGRTWDEYPA